jgi:uncharacterized membrane protein
VFKAVDPAILSIAFSLPIFAFVTGCWFRREQVRAVVAHPAIRSERRMLGAFLWLFPTFILGGGVLLLSHVAEPLANTAMVLIAAMTPTSPSSWSMQDCCSRSSSSASSVRPSVTPERHLTVGCGVFDHGTK